MKKFIRDSFAKKSTWTEDELLARLFKTRNFWNEIGSERVLKAIKAMAAQMTIECNQGRLVEHNNGFNVYHWTKS